MAPAEHVTPDELLALVDGQLDPLRAAEVGQAIASDPEAVRRVQAYRAQNRDLRQAFRVMFDEPIPMRLRPVAIRAARRRSVRRQAAAAALLLALGTGSGWLLRGATQPSAAEVDLAPAAMVAHRTFVPEIRHPVEVAAEQEAHLVGWLSKRLGRSIKAPSLAPLGFRLMGGRLLPANQGPAAQFMYEDTGGRRLTLYARAATGRDDGRERDTAFRFVEDRGLAGFYWTDGGTGYALIGELDRAALHDAVVAVHRELAN